MKPKRILYAAAIALCPFAASAIDHPGITQPGHPAESFALISDGIPTSILVSDADEKGISIAAANLSADFGRVSGSNAPIVGSADGERNLIIVGTEKNPLIAKLIKEAPH